MWGGRLIDRLFVRRDVERIFAFRQVCLAREFGRGTIDPESFGKPAVEKPSIP
jgi:hypothetical protein